MAKDNQSVKEPTKKGYVSRKSKLKNKEFIHLLKVGMKKNRKSDKTIASDILRTVSNEDYILNQKGISKSLIGYFLQ